MLWLNGSAFLVLCAAAACGATAYALGAAWVPVGVAVFLGALLVLGALGELAARRRSWAPPTIFWIVPLWYGGLGGLAKLAHDHGPRPLGLALPALCGVLAVAFVVRRKDQPGGGALVVGAAALLAQIVLELAERAGQPAFGHALLRPALGIAILTCALVYGYQRKRANGPAMGPRRAPLPNARSR